MPLKERASHMIREREQLMQQLMELLRIEKKSDIAVLISQYQPADIAEILTELETHYRGTVFSC